MSDKSGQKKLLDDAGFRGGSPKDRVIGMLLERTEAIRELHQSMRDEMRELIDTHSEIKNMVTRIIDRQEAHEKADREAFAQFTSNNQTIIVRLDGLTTLINSAVTANVIQKAQFNAGWRVIVWVGGTVATLFAIFAIFFNHNWGK